MSENLTMIHGETAYFVGKSYRCYIGTYLAMRKLLNSNDIYGHICWHINCFYSIYRQCAACFIGIKFSEIHKESEMKKFLVGFIFFNLLIVSQVFAVQLSPTDDTCGFQQTAAPCTSLALGSMTPYSDYLQILLRNYYRVCEHLPSI